MRTYKRLFMAMLSASTFSLCALNASATLILLDGNQANLIDVENVLFNEEQGLLVTGVLNQSGQIVNFESDEQLVSSGGQCCLNAVDGNLNLVEWYLDNSLLGFDDLVFNIQGPGLGSSTIDVTLIDQFGAEFFYGNIAIGNGQNFFTVTSFDDQVMVRAIVESSTGFLGADLQQVRLGLAQTAQAPEPGVLSLLGLGLLGFGAVLARRRRGG